MQEKKSYGLLVNHNGHTHVISYEQLIQSKWEYLIPAEYKKSAEERLLCSKRSNSVHASTRFFKRK
ncbi:hypothetical protein PUW41_04525 [Streptococcus anginosus]|nr:hypothetical protein PUW41_04525 [Streptococcus anginosus]